MGEEMGGGMTRSERVVAAIAELERLLRSCEAEPGGPWAVKMLEQFNRMLATFITQNRKYGNSWLEGDLGPAMLFVESAAKGLRLKNLMWERPLLEWDVAKVVETIRDRIVYDLLTIMRIEREVGPIDEAAVKVEVDRT